MTLYNLILLSMQQTIFSSTVSALSSCQPQITFLFPQEKHAQIKKNHVHLVAIFKKSLL